MAKRLVEIESAGSCTTCAAGGMLACCDCGRAYTVTEIRSEVKVPEDDQAEVTPEWVKSIIVKSSIYGGLRGGKFGEIGWTQMSKDEATFDMRLNGCYLKWQLANRGDLRRLCAALGIELKEGG